VVVLDLVIRGGAVVDGSSAVSRRPTWHPVGNGPRAAGGGPRAP